MTHFDEEAALDLLERGIRLAQGNPGEVVRVEFTKLNACVDLSVDWEEDGTLRSSPPWHCPPLRTLSVMHEVSSRGLVLASTPCAVWFFVARLHN